MMRQATKGTDILGSNGSEMFDVLLDVVQLRSTFVSSPRSGIWRSLAGYLASYKLDLDVRFGNSWRGFLFDASGRFLGRQCG